MGQSYPYFWYLSTPQKSNGHDRLTPTLYILTPRHPMEPTFLRTHRNVPMSYLSMVEDYHGLEPLRGPSNNPIPAI